ncbi:MAG: ABC transporter permease [Clostridia bacterium]|nr:ABC transporter permease [Clostridia bacterium]
MSNAVKAVKEPLFHIEKRASLPAWKAWAIRGGALLVALVVSCILSGLFLGGNPFAFFSSVFSGAFGTSTRINTLLKELSLLLCVSLAVVPAFKMKFWNLGANGQILAGCIATTACMIYLNGVVPPAVLYILMFVSAILAGAIWAVIPAIFKAIWNTNESLFTLMMNYIAEGLVAFFLTLWATDGSGTLNPIKDAMLPKIGGEDFILPLIVAIVLTAAMYIYMRFTKHGYEISVVGESENTAKYVGINVKKVVIRTLIVSGALCGLVGCLLSGAINGNISTSMHDGMGFTAIMVAWLAKFNPAIMAVMAFVVIFVERGAAFASRQMGVTNSAFPSIVTGIIFFFVIACEFFIEYKLKFRSKKKGGNE